MLEFDAGVIGCELPVGFGVMGIAVSLPSGCGGRGIAIGERRVRIPPYRANCRALACNAIRTARRAVLPYMLEKPRKRCGFVSVEIVLHQNDLGIREVTVR